MQPFSTFFVRTLLIHSLFLSGLLSGSVYAQDYTSPESIDGVIRINAEELIELANTYEQLVIIDARIQTDRKQGYIAGSVSLPDTQTDCGSLVHHIRSKTSPVVFYCNGLKCRRSDRAVAIARDCGYSQVYWFRGGFEEWKNKSYSISK